MTSLPAWPEACGTRLWRDQCRRNPSHRVSVQGIVTWNRQDADSVGSQLVPGLSLTYAPDRSLPERCRRPDTCPVQTGRARLPAACRVKRSDCCALRGSPRHCAIARTLRLWCRRDCGAGWAWMSNATSCCGFAGSTVKALIRVRSLLSFEIVGMAGFQAVTAGGPAAVFVSGGGGGAGSPGPARGGPRPRLL